MYNPYFYNPQPMPAPAMPQAQNNNGLIWVQGVEGAKSYLVAPENTVLLMDSEGSKFYLKSADRAGMPTLREFTYTENTQKAQEGLPNTPREDLPTKADIEALKGQYESLITELNELKTQVKTELNARDKLAKAKRVVSDDE